MAKEFYQGPEGEWIPEEEEAEAGVDPRRKAFEERIRRRKEERAARFGARSQRSRPGFTGYRSEERPSSRREHEPENLRQATVSTFKEHRRTIANMMYEMSKEVLWRLGIGTRIKRAARASASAVWKAFKKHILRLG